jgi:hypothetical protein
MLSVTLSSSMWAFWNCETLKITYTYRSKHIGLLDIQNLSKYSSILTYTYFVYYVNIPQCGITCKDCRDTSSSSDAGN